WKNVFVPFGKFLGTTIMAVLKALTDAFVALWQSTLKPLANFVKNVLIVVFRNAFEGIGGVINGIKQTFIGLMNFITGVFTGDWRKAWQGVKDIFAGIMSGLWAAIKTPLNMIIDGLNALIKGINKIKIDVPGWVEDLTG